jgi:hypothetical protein
MGVTEMRLDAALIREQGVNFAVVVVKKSVLTNLSRRDSVALSFSRQYFGGVPVVLMAQSSNGVPTYYGRPDLVKWLANVPVEVLPWKRWQAA